MRSLVSFCASAMIVKERQARRGTKRTECILDGDGEEEEVQSRAGEQQDRLMAVALLTATEPTR